MTLIQESFQRLFPEKEFKYKTYLEYNRRLGNFNANIKYDYRKISIHLNLQWKDIEDEIKIGLIQTLLVKVFKSKKRQTSNINLYNNFIKNIPTLTEKVHSDPVLESSFHRVNNEFFFNQIEKPNLKWGTDSKRKLASYNFHDDTVTVSTIFKESREELLDYLMYHELLHKHHKFNHKNGRSFFHTKQFKSDENLYPNKMALEREISKIIRNSRVPKKKSVFSFFR
jgi:predicted metal-dependent hydrolase